MEFQNFTKLIIYLIILKTATCSKLNVPRVLLPLFHDFATNFTLEVKESGCYKWSTLRPNILNLKQLYVDPELGCSSEVVISASTKEFRRNSETVLAEDVHSGQILRCEVILDVISTLNVITTTRELFLEESPETFEVRAYDDQGNAFTTLEGVEFEWSLHTGGQSEKTDKRSSECSVVRFISFGDSPYETPPSVAYFDKIGVKGHIVLLEGVQTGVATVSVRLPHKEYKHIPSMTVQLMVLTNLIITPSDVTILNGDSIKYRLYQVQHGKVNEIFFPSKQYYLQSENPKCLKVDRNTGIGRGLMLCKTRVVLVDQNVISVENDVKPPTATVIVSSPQQLALAILPSRKWIVTVGQFYEISVEIFDTENRKMYIGDGVEVKTFISDEFFKTNKMTANGTYIYGMPLKRGQTKVSATLMGVVDDKGAMHRTEELSAEATMQIYDAIEVNPSSVLLPWDPVTKCKYEVPLTVTGGDGNFIWTSSNNSIAVVTQMGIVKTLEEGFVKISAAMTRNHYNKGTSEFCITRPYRLEILDYIMEAEVGAPIQLYIVLYGLIKGEEIPFTLCDALPFDVGLADDNFDYIPGNSSHRIGSSCSSITLVGRSPGATRVTVCYKDLIATAVIAAHRKLRVSNPEEGLTILSVGTSRNISFVGGPRPWAIRPSEHYHKLDCLSPEGADWDDIIELEEREDNTHSQHRDHYVYRVSCLKLGQVSLTLTVSNKVPASNNKPIEENTNVTVICGKPRYLLLVPVVKKIDASRCPMHLSSERIISQNYRNIELEIVVNDVQGRKFDNVTSLEIDWSLSHQSLAKLINPEEWKSVTVKEEDIEYPCRFYQILQPRGRTGVLDVKASISGYNSNFLEALDIIPECPAFPEKNKKGQWVTPDIDVSLSIILVNDTIITPNLTEIYNHEKAVSQIQVSQGSGFYDFILNNKDIVSIRYSEETRLIELRPLELGRVQISLVDLCLEARPATLDVKVYTIGSIRLDVPERVERGKSIVAVVVLYDEGGDKLNSVPDIDLIHLKPLAESDIIKVKPFQEKGQRPGELRYLVSGVMLGNTFLKFSAGQYDEEIFSRSAPIQVFPGLRIHPRNVTMLVGSTLQVTTFDGPSDGSIEFSVDNPALAKVDCDGVIDAVKIGRTMLYARSANVFRDTGEKVIDSEDCVEVNIVPLKGVTIMSPITRIVQGATMPLWAVGIPEELDAMRLGATKYDLLFIWDVNNENYGQVRSVFDGMGIQVPESDQVTMRFKALKPGRVVVTLTVEVPPQVAGSTFKKVFTDSLVIEVHPELCLLKPNMDLSNILLSTNAELNLRTNREGISPSRMHYYVTPLPGPGGPSDSDCVVSVNENGKLKSTSSFGRSEVSFVVTEDFGVKTWRSVTVSVKPVHYIMLNVDSKLKIKSSEQVSVLPSGLDLDFYVSFHDNFGNQFDAVRSSLLLESNQKGCLLFNREDLNTSIVVSIIDTGFSMLKVWDGGIPHQPSDYIKIHSGDVIFPVNSQITVGDVVCFRMPLTCGEDPTQAWSVSDPQILQFYEDIAVGVAMNKPGLVVVSYQSKKKLTTTLEVFPIRKIIIPQTDVILSTVLGKEYHVPVVLLSTVEQDDKCNNLISYNGSCNGGIDNFKVSTFPFACIIRFNNPVPQIDIGSVFTVQPDFNIKTGFYSCKICAITGPSKKVSVLSENVIVRAESDSGLIKSPPQTVDFLPGVFVHQSELKVYQTKGSDLLSITGISETLNQVKVLPEYKNLITIAVEDETHTMKTFIVEIDETWWTMEDPPQLSVLVWSKITDQKIKVPIRIGGYRQASFTEGSGRTLQWVIGVLVGIATLLVLYCNYLRPLRLGPLHPGESHFMAPFSYSHGMAGTSGGSPGTHALHSPDDQLFVRPFGESPVYGSPQRYRCNTQNRSFT